MVKAIFIATAIIMVVIAALEVLVITIVALALEKVSRYMKDLEG